jgi:hypothetical protein
LVERLFRNRLASDFVNDSAFPDVGWHLSQAELNACSIVGNAELYGLSVSQAVI